MFINFSKTISMKKCFSLCIRPSGRFKDEPVFCDTVSIQKLKTQCAGPQTRIFFLKLLLVRVLTLIRRAGGLYDFRKFEEIQLKMA
jgi:hypothetical protein